jgi:hypothetical protein
MPGAVGRFIVGRRSRPGIATKGTEQFLGSALRKRLANARAIRDSILFWGEAPARGWRFLVSFSFSFVSFFS